MNPENDVSSPSRKCSNTRSKIGSCVNIGALGALSVIVAFLFVQLQVVTTRLASEQRQIDQLEEQIQTSAIEINTQVEQQRDFTIINIAGTFTLLSCLVTTFHMTAHLRKMNQPFVQRKILAILWMSPIYGVTSFLCLILPPSAEPIMEIVKDFYESYVIYQFLGFLIAVLGRGDREAVVRSLALHADHLRRPYKCLNCLFHPRPEEGDEAMANAVLLECQVLAMQFVFFRPATSIIGFVLHAVGAGVNDGSTWSYLYSPQFFLLMIQNVSVFLAFSGLLKFYHAVRDDLAWCQPFAKFMTIKGVVFMTFWQGLAIRLIFHFNQNNSDNENEEEEDSTSDSNTATSIQHILICMEMLFFSVAHFCVFPAEEWEDGYVQKFYEGPGFGFKDFASDVNLIIDSGKRSLQARRERKKYQDSAMEDSDGETTSPLGSTGEACDEQQVGGLGNGSLA